jgi:hypothetical protein
MPFSFKVIAKWRLTEWLSVLNGVYVIIVTATDR